MVAMVRRAGEMDAMWVGPRKPKLAILYDNYPSFTVIFSRTPQKTWFEGVGGGEETLEKSYLEIQKVKECTMILWKMGENPAFQ